MILATDQNADGHPLSAKAGSFLAMRSAVMTRWEREVRARVEGANDLLTPALTNMLPAFYDNIAEALSPGHPRRDGTSNTNAAAVHGGERARMTPFGPEQIIHEYQILRECIAAEAAATVELTAVDWAVIDRSLNHAMREAVREFAAIQDDLRRKVAAALSHDMRTPLAVVANGAQLIQIAPDMDMARRAATKIESSALRLGEMMGELLDALTGNAGDAMMLELSRFDIRDLVREVCAGYAHASSTLVESTSESVIGHWSRNAMRRALENLVNNAATYGDGQGVGLSAKAAHGRVLLSVRNTGNPIGKDRLGSLFEQSSREGGSHAKGGWGIGLPFVKQVAESHGGSVAVDSSQETGTTFLIDVPIDCRPFAGPATT
ncbi:sensor histidine kinase [Pseudoduganella lutea]|nr:HAMP domain-containing sensor histidine kinase [Pseudoduganella lutea]